MNLVLWGVLFFQGSQLGGFRLRGFYLGLEGDLRVLGL